MLLKCVKFNGLFIKTWTKIVICMKIDYSRVGWSVVVAGDFGLAKGPLAIDQSWLSVLDWGFES